MCAVQNVLFHCQCHCHWATKHIPIIVRIMFSLSNFSIFSQVYTYLQDKTLHSGHCFLFFYGPNVFLIRVLHYRYRTITIFLTGLSRPSNNHQKPLPIFFMKLPTYSLSLQPMSKSALSATHPRFPPSIAFPDPTVNTSTHSYITPYPKLCSLTTKSMKDMIQLLLENLVVCPKYLRKTCLYLKKGTNALYPKLWNKST